MQNKQPETYAAAAGNLQVVNYHHAMSEQTAIIVSRGRKLMHILMIESAGIVCRSVPLIEERHCRPLAYRGKDYPLKKAINHYLRIATKLGGTKRARKALKEMKANLVAEEFM